MTDDPLLAAFRRFGDDLAPRTAAFVRTGEDATVLATLGAIDRSTEARHASWSKPAEDRAALGACARSPDCLWRLGRVWVAADRPRAFVAELAGDATWVEVVVWIATSVSPQSSTRVTTALHADALAQAMAAGGLDPATIVRIVCRRVADAAPPAGVFARRNFTDALLAMPGMAELVVRHAEVVRDALEGGSAATRVEILANLRAASTPPASFLDALAPLAAAPQRTVASAALTVLAAIPEQAREAVRPFLDASSATERQGAITALLALGQTDLAPFEARLVVETSAPVRKALEAAIASRRTSPAEVAAPTPRAPVPPLGDHAFRLLRACADAWHRETSAETQRRRAAYPLFRDADPEPLTDDAIRDVLARLQDQAAWPLQVPDARAPVVDVPWLEDAATLRALASSPLLSIVHVVRAVALGTRHPERRMHLLDVLAPGKATRGSDLAAVADACDLAGIDGRVVALAALTRGLAWGDEAVLALLAARPEALEVALSVRAIEGVEVPTYWQSDARKSALLFLGRMPRVPPTPALGTGFDAEWESKVAT